MHSFKAEAARVFLHLMRTSMGVLGWVHVVGQAPRSQAIAIGELAMKSFDAFYNNIYSP